MSLCDYCHEREGKYLLQNGKLCCEKIYHKCPAHINQVRQLCKDRAKFKTNRLMNLLIQNNLVECYYCGKPATNYRGVNDKNEHVFTCCQKLRVGCEAYKKIISEQQKKRYENPLEKFKMKKIMLKVQNRDEVKEKKSETMLNLHHGDCEPCKQFQKNFKEAHKQRRTENYERNLRYIQNSKRKDK